MPGTIFSFTPRKVSRDFSIQLPFLFLLQDPSVRDLAPSEYVRGIRRNWEHGTDPISAGFSLDGFILRQVLLLKDPLLGAHREITRITLCPHEHFGEPKTGHFTINTQQKVHSVGIFLSWINSTEENGTKWCPMLDTSSGLNIWNRVSREENKKEIKAWDKRVTALWTRKPWFLTIFFVYSLSLIIIGRAKVELGQSRPLYVTLNLSNLYISKGTRPSSAEVTEVYLSKKNLLGEGR